MKKKLAGVLIALVLMGLGVGNLSYAAQVQTAGELVHGVYQLLRADSYIMQIRMEVKTPDYQRTDMMKIYMEGEEKALIKLIAPQEGRGTGWLKLGNKLWMYIPSIGQLMKIPPAMMMQPFRGSAFSYDDLVKESSIVQDYTPKIIASEAQDGVTVYTLELDPKPTAPVVYGKVLLWVREDFVPTKEEFYDENGDPIKVCTFGEIKELGGRRIPTVWVMQNLEEKGNLTTLTITKAQFNVKIDPLIFTLAYLKDPTKF